MRTALTCLCLALGAAAVAQEEPKPEATPPPPAEAPPAPAPTEAAPAEQKEAPAEPPPKKKVKAKAPAAPAAEAPAAAPPALEKAAPAAAPPPAPAPAPAAPAPAPAPAAAAPAPSAPLAPPSDVEAVKGQARVFFANLLLGDARALVEQAAYPFQMEDRKLNTQDELLQEWLKQLRQKRTDLLTLYGIEVLTPADMEKKYGKPPARLSAFANRGPKTYLAVANISGHAAIALFREVGPMWRVAGYHD